MRDAGELQGEFGERPFRRRDAADSGFARGDIDDAALHRPFRGVRSFGAVEDMVERCRAYAVKVPPGRAFTGLSAAAIRGWPIPRRMRGETDVFVAGKRSGGPLRERGVTSVRVADHRWQVTNVRGLPVVSPELALLELAKRCSQRELVVLGDAAVTESTWYPDLVDRGSTTVVRLEAFVDGLGRTHGAPALRAALQRVRASVDSTMESLTRLALVDAGLPEPEVQGEVWHDGEKIATCDLVYRAEKIAIEYEGAHHRRADIWEQDIARIRRLEAAGWRVFRLTKADLFPSADRFIAEVRLALVERAVA